MIERAGLHDMLTACYSIRRFFMRHNIPLDGVRLTIHVPDTKTQWQFDCSVKEETSGYLIMTEKTLPPNTYTFASLQVSVVNPEQFDRL